MGVGAARVRDLFAKARKTAPAIIFIDEFDAAGRKRGAGIGQGNDEREQTLNALLVEMDGFSGDGGLVVMGATNRPDILDPALLRPGRFDRQVTIDVPDVHGRLEILRLHGAKRPLGPDVSLEEIAHQTPGFSGAELANVINEAALLSVRDSNHEIDQATLEESIDRVVAGPAKKHILTREERWLISMHEASHAVVTDALGHTTSTRKFSIVARGRTLGTAAHMLTDRDQVIQTEQDLQRQLIVIVGWHRRRADRVRQPLHRCQRRPARRDVRWRAAMVTSFGMSCGARAGHDRREGRRGVPRRLASGSRLGRPLDAGPDRPRGRAPRRRRRSAGPAFILDRNWTRRRGDRQRAARAGDAVRRRAGCRARRPCTRSTLRASCASVRPCADLPSETRGADLEAPASGARPAGSRRSPRRIASAGARRRRPGRSELAPGTAGAARRRGLQGPPRHARRHGVLRAQRGAAERRRQRDRSPPACSSTTGATGTSSRPSAAAPGEASRIAWAGPDEFWVITEPSEPRAGAGPRPVPFRRRRRRRLLLDPLSVARTLPSDGRRRLRRAGRLLVRRDRQRGSLRPADRRLSSALEWDEPDRLLPAPGPRRQRAGVLRRDVLREHVRRRPGGRHDRTRDAGHARSPKVRV